MGMGLTSCWGDTPDPTQHTTYSARTFLQPQLNKAAKKDELVAKGDVNPKDFVLFYPFDLQPTFVGKDNTGLCRFPAHRHELAGPCLPRERNHEIFYTA